MDEIWCRHLNLIRCISTDHIRQPAPDFDQPQKRHSTNNNEVDERLIIDEASVFGSWSPFAQVYVSCWASGVSGLKQTRDMTKNMGNIQQSKRFFASISCEDMQQQTAPRRTVTLGVLGRRTKCETKLGVHSGRPVWNSLHNNQKAGTTRSTREMQHK